MTKGSVLRELTKLACTKGRVLRELTKLAWDLRRQACEREAIEIRCGVWRMREEQIAARIESLRQQIVDTKQGSEHE